VTLDGLPALREVPSVTAAQMAEVDRITIQELHIPVHVLMENASRQIAAAARALLGGTVAGKRIIGLVGTGNNGGDAAGALRHLANWGADVLARFVGPRQHLSQITRIQLGRLNRATNDWRAALPYDAVQERLDDLDGDLVIDGLLGYGARGAPRETVAMLIDAANTSHVPILAVDLPSGIDPDSGEVSGAAIRAAATVTLALPKPGLLVPATREYVGALLLADVAVPHTAFKRVGVDTRRLFAEGDLLRIVA
jgi:NAD(P)H-hydrate epimerase